MPLFFIIAGIFISKSLAKTQITVLIKIKFENLIYPYLIWCGIQISLQILFNSYTNSNRSFIDYTYMFYHPRSLDQFWYLPALFNTSLLFIFLSKYNLKPIIHLLFACTLYFASSFFREISMI
ncbi:MAG: acyltransferase family protein [Ignavibacteria bacterium]|nr:acyltransferase family protein [Ignavibacteria bacterium]